MTTPGNTRTDDSDEKATLEKARLAKEVERLERDIARMDRDATGNNDRSAESNRRVVFVMDSAGGVTGTPR
jgi:predicted phosphoribosyltransferase